jgi:glycosyltransferase involved in cell wall biosynthesis
MRITLVTPHFPPRYLAGVELHTQRLSASLASQGHRPDVVCVEGIDATAGAISVRSETGAACPVHRLTPRSGDFRRSYHDSEVRQWLVTRLRAHASDVLHLQSGYLLGGSALLAAQDLGVPCVVMLHDYWFVCPRITLMHPSGRPCTGPDHGAKCAWCLNADRRVLRAADRATRGLFSRVMARTFRLPALASFARWEIRAPHLAERSAQLAASLSRAEVVAASTEYLARRVVSSLKRPVEVRVVRCGIDLGVVARTGARRQPTSTVRVAYLGQVAHHKGIDVLVRAVRALPHAPLELRVHGDLQREPAYAARLRRLAGDDTRIHLMGGYHNDKVGEILADVDVVVVPSRWPENYPAVILEAQACGVPVIASRAGGMPEMVRDGIDGVLVEPDHIAQLSATLGRCCTDRAYLPGLAAAVRPPRSHVDEAREWVSLYEEARARRAGRSRPGAGS